MGKLTDTHRLKCVHCHNTETPLWRTGPDGPKTLCNACGVRFKKGKLILYKDDDGNITAIKREDSIPVHVPPPTKKSLKKPLGSSPVASPTLTDPAKRTVRKVPSEPSIHPAAVGKKPRSRVRRANAGQLPGRYLSKLCLDSQSHLQWRSSSDSLDGSSPSSPADSPRLSDISSPPLTVPSSLSMDDLPPVHHLSSAYPDEDNLFSDMACLGLDASPGAENHTLLPMPADPSSAEQFTFAFSGIGRDACLALDTPDRADALRSLLLDRTCNVSSHYDTAVQAISRLYEHRRRQDPFQAERWPTADDCKNFVRSFAQLHNLALPVDGPSDPMRDQNQVPVCNPNPSSVTLSEKSLHSAAVESLRTLMDSSELFGFAEACLIELLAEDVAAALHHQGIPEYEHGTPCRLSDSKISQLKSISTPA